MKYELFSQMSQTFYKHKFFKLQATTEIYYLSFLG